MYTLAGPLVQAPPDERPTYCVGCPSDGYGAYGDLDFAWIIWLPIILGGLGGGTKLFVQWRQSKLERESQERQSKAARVTAQAAKQTAEIQQETAKIQQETSQIQKEGSITGSTITVGDMKLPTWAVLAGGALSGAMIYVLRPRGWKASVKTPRKQRR